MGLARPSWSRWRINPTGVSEAVVSSKSVSADARLISSMTVRSNSMMILRNAGVRFWLRAVGWASVVGLAIGIPTVLVPNPFFSRMTPVRPWDTALWVGSAALVGMTLAARKLPGARNCRIGSRALGGGGLAYLAVGCPICNKIVVALLGVSGALSYFAPIQPILGATGLVLTVFALRTALRAAMPRSPGHTSMSDPSDIRQPSLT